MNQKRIDYEIILFLLKQESHGRELSKQLKVPLTTIQRTLKFLEKENILDVKLEGKNKIYIIKNYLKTEKYVFNAENYKFIKLINKCPFLEPLFEQILNQTKSKLIILFGSFARFAAQSTSDIDIYIETENSNIKKEISLINSRLSIKIGKFNTKSLLVKEIIKNHVIIKGVEYYYDKIKFFEKLEE